MAAPVGVTCSWPSGHPMCNNSTPETRGGGLLAVVKVPWGVEVQLDSI